MGKELTLFTFFAFLASFTLLVDLSFLRTLYQHPSALCYDDHLRSLAKDSHSLSDPTTLKTPPGDYETQNFSRDDFI